MATALVFGATGLVGSKLVENLILDNYYDRIILFVRKKVISIDPKISQVVVDNFKSNTDWVDQVHGTDLFCCLGTTIKKAGSKDAFKAVDLELPVKLAKVARQNNVSGFIVISSLGANSTSKNFYLSVKGEMEDRVIREGPDKVIIVRPSIILGDRKEKRPGEFIAKYLMQLISPLFSGNLKKYKPVYANSIAVSMINAAKKDTGKLILESDSLRASKKGYTSASLF